MKPRQPERHVLLAEMHTTCDFHAHIFVHKACTAKNSSASSDSSTKGKPNQQGVRRTSHHRERECHDDTTQQRVKENGEPMEQRGTQANYSCKGGQKFHRWIVLGGDYSRVHFFQISILYILNTNYIYSKWKATKTEPSDTHSTATLLFLK